MKKLIFRLFENSGDLFARAIFFSCALTPVGFLLINKIIFPQFPVNKKILGHIIFIDLYIIAIALVCLVASNEIINLDSYRNRTGIRDLGMALSAFFNETKSMVKMAFAIVMLVSTAVISIGFGFGMGIALTRWVIRG